MLGNDRGKPSCFQSIVAHTEYRDGNRWFETAEWQICPWKAVLCPRNCRGRTNFIDRRLFCGPTSTTEAVFSKKNMFGGSEKHQLWGFLQILELVRDPRCYIENLQWRTSQDARKFGTASPMQRVPPFRKGIAAASPCLAKALNESQWWGTHSGPLTSAVYFRWIGFI